LFDDVATQLDEEKDAALIETRQKEVKLLKHLWLAK
jgi:recombinational DNA repair ATPase RecF